MNFNKFTDKYPGTTAFIAFATLLLLAWGGNIFVPVLIGLITLLMILGGIIFGYGLLESRGFIRSARSKGNGYTLSEITFGDSWEEIEQDMVKLFKLNSQDTYDDICRRFLQNVNAIAEDQQTIPKELANAISRKMSYECYRKNGTLQFSFKDREKTRLTSCEVVRRLSTGERNEFINFCKTLSKSRSTLNNPDVNQPSPISETPLIDSRSEASPLTNSGSDQQISTSHTETAANSSEVINDSEINSPHQTPPENGPSSINTITQPLQTTTPSALKTLSANEIILYQETDAFHSTSVLVTDRRLKANNDSYSLEGVNAVSLQIIRKRLSWWRLFLRVLLWGTFWVIAISVSCLFIQVGTMNGTNYSFSSFMLFLKMLFSSWLLAAVPLIFAIRASMKDEVYCYFMAQIVLIRSGHVTKICIDDFYQYPEDDAAAFLKN